jgi:DnaK suppressor protein
MAARPTDLDIPLFDIRLRARLRTLRTRIHDTLLRCDAETYAELAGRVHDAEEDAIADLLVDVNLAELTREVEEVRDIDAALRRILGGVYGVCVDCGERIEGARLQAYPTAKRCLECQRVRDRSPLAAPTPKL